MRVILTHEQADLDALASLLGAHLLDKDAYALLPRQINRNGQAFLQKFQQELGFNTVSDLPGESITQVTLVDTQSLITLKGFSARTHVSVIDHHPRKAHTDPEWAVELHETGACTTVLVEKLQKAQTPFSASQATLLLLGIYEDTGSLSYAMTTPRDLLAAAFLLEHGADLSTASRYLNPPLSNAQMLLYDRLMKDITAHKIHDFTILVAKANALDIQDEISTVAHHMREFLNPDGLVLLVSTRQGIRLVARSTTDEIDMAQLAHRFGGGGHKRAASALIRSESRPTPNEVPVFWKKTYQYVVEMLPEIVHPSMRVQQIMSRKPLLVSPDMPVETVADLMKRYGFEGYPVIEEGKVVGLITRRNVDRALSHRMMANAGILMDAGTVYVTPGDTLDYLQEVMASSGWGQVPVLDPESGEIIGIVTRTDLINTHALQNNIPNQDEMVRRLHNAIPYPRQILLQAVARLAGKLNMQAYIVGGFVRDLLLKQPSQDFDIVVEGDANVFVAKLVEIYGGRAVTHSRFGTAKWIIGDEREALAQKLLPDQPMDFQALPQHLDLITARTEFYERPAALPTVERSGIKMDLHRRDFTINTMALRLDAPYYGKLYDFWGGYHDLQNHIIRVLHALSFVDDATRILRAIRFSTRFDFRMDPRTLSLLSSSLSLLNEISGSRLRHELDLILLEFNVGTALRAMDRLSVLEVINPNLNWNPALEARIAFLNQPAAQAEWKTETHENQLNLRQVLGYCYWLEDLSPEQLEQVSARLRIPARVTSAISDTAKLRRLLPELGALKPSQVVNALKGISPLALTAVYQSTEDPALREPLRLYQTRYLDVKPLHSGDDLRARGLPPSPEFQRILNALRDAWLDGSVSSPEEEDALLEQLLNAT
ncbi:MAG TPA: CBS domain-containing protein [Anaerolineaceae bacterium]|nr:CBS domain-containing protein [Anaerolineaceae bacterium]HPS32921.1 CBS domain-containing protein [Anaerolineaceae bacterium]